MHGIHPTPLLYPIAAPADLSTLRMACPRISLCMIVKNEAADIAACMESARGAFDEWIVVDTGSTDDTKKIAASLGAKVLDFEWVNDFAAARNCALNAATGDFILVLDADERIGSGGAERIREAVRHPGAAAFSMEVVSDVGTGVPQRVWLVRLFLRKPEIRYVRRLHESVNEAIFEYNKKHATSTFSIPVEILHSGYLPDRFVSLDKRRRNIQLHELTVAERPGDAYAWYRYGDELRALDPKKSVPVLEHAWKLLLEMPRAKRDVQVYAPEVPVVLAYLQLEKGDAAGALARLESAERHVIPTPNFIYVRAIANIKLQKWRDALECYLQLRQIDGQRFIAPVQPGITGSIACRGMAECYENLGDLAAAARALEESLTLDPPPGQTHGRATIALAQIYQKSGDVLKGRQLLDAYLLKNPADGPAWVLSGRMALESGAPAAAAKRFGVAASASDAPEAVLVELAVAQAMSGDFDSASATFVKIKNPELIGALEKRLASVARQ